MKIRYNEALEPEEKREVDTWKHGETSFSDHAFESPAHKRTYISLDHSTKGEHEDEITQHLAKHGYTMHSYRDGLAKDRFGRLVKIGKALGKTQGDHLLNKFTGDPIRQQKEAKSDYHVVISRHPHDVAGMTSKGHSWEQSSCMNFKSGMNKHYLPAEVEQGTHVAYFAHKDDIDLERPLARIALKPFIGINSGHRILRPETRTYGDASGTFKTAVHNWAESKFPADDSELYERHKETYNDSGFRLVGSQKAFEANIFHPDPEILHEIASSGHLGKEAVHDMAAYANRSLSKNSSIALHKTLLSNKNIDIGSDTLHRMLDNAKVGFDARIGMTADFHDVASRVVAHRNADSTHVDKIMSIPGHERSDWLMSSILKSPGFTAKHIDKHIESLDTPTTPRATDNFKHTVQVLAANKNFNQQHIKSLIEKSDPHMVSKAAMHAKISDKGVQDTLLEHMTKTGSDEHPVNRVGWLSNSARSWDFSGDKKPNWYRMVDAANEMHSHVRGQSDNILMALGNQDRNIDKDQFEHLMQHAKTGSAKQYLIKNNIKHVTDKHIDDLIDNHMVDVSPASLFSHGVLKSQHVTKLLNSVNDRVRDSAIVHAPSIPDDVFKHHVDTAAEPRNKLIIPNAYAIRFRQQDAAGNQSNKEERRKADEAFIRHPVMNVAENYIQSRHEYRSHEFEPSLAAHAINRFPDLGLHVLGNVKDLTHPEVRKAALETHHGFTTEQYVRQLHSQGEKLTQSEHEALVERNDPHVNHALVSTGLRHHTAHQVLDNIIGNLDHRANASALTDFTKGYAASSIYAPELHLTDYVAHSLADKAIKQEKETGHISFSHRSELSSLIERHGAKLAGPHPHISHKAIDSLYDKVSSIMPDTAAKLAENHHISYDRWKKERMSERGSLFAQANTNPEHHHRFSLEELKESVFSSKLKVWILE